MNGTSEAIEYTPAMQACTHRGSFTYAGIHVPPQNIRLAGRFWVTQHGAAFSAIDGRAADSAVPYRLDINSITRRE